MSHDILPGRSRWRLFWVIWNMLFVYFDGLGEVEGGCDKYHASLFFLMLMKSVMSFISHWRPCVWRVS